MLLVIPLDAECQTEFVEFERFNAFGVGSDHEIFGQNLILKLHC